MRRSAKIKVAIARVPLRSRLDCPPRPDITVAPGASGSASTTQVRAPVARSNDRCQAAARPSSVAPVLRVMSVFARMVPMKAEFTPRVAELPTCQKTFPACAPLMSTIELLEAVISVDPA